jgi:hypothetical protein
MAQNIPVETTYQPWWFRILEKQGIATVFALLLLGGTWRLADAHLNYLRLQSDQMAQQSKILSAISDSSQRQEKAIVEMKHTIIVENRMRMQEHSAMLKVLEGLLEK